MTHARPTWNQAADFPRGSVHNMDIERLRSSLSGCSPLGILIYLFCVFFRSCLESSGSLVCAFVYANPATDNSGFTSTCTIHISVSVCACAYLCIHACLLVNGNVGVFLRFCVSAFLRFCVSGFCAFVRLCFHA